MLENKAKLIRDFFELSGADAIRQIKELPSEDREQLASAIARDKGLTQEQVDFPLVDY